METKTIVFRKRKKRLEKKSEKTKTKFMCRAKDTMFKSLLHKPFMIIEQFHPKSILKSNINSWNFNCWTGMFNLFEINSQNILSFINLLFQLVSQHHTRKWTKIQNVCSECHHLNQALSSQQLYQFRSAAFWYIHTNTTNIIRSYMPNSVQSVCARWQRLRERLFLLFLQHCC